MKKTRILLMALIPALALGSCVKENGIDGKIDNPVGTDPIVFGLEADSETRAVPVTGTILAESSKFGVYAYHLLGETSKYNLNNDFNNLAATVSTGNTVNYGTPKNWPANPADKILFLAYYPHDASGVNKEVNSGADNTDPFLKLTYTVPEVHTNHQDLMVASALPNYKSTVGLTFNHILTRLTFEARKSLEFGSDAVAVKKISIKNVKNTGTLTINSTVAPTNASWSALSESGAKTYSTGESFTSAPIILDYSTSSYNKIETMADDSFMVIPLVSSFGDAEIEIIATWKGVQMQPFSIKLAEIDHEENKWEIGKHVNYQFELKPTGIAFTGVTVTKWGEKKDVPVVFP